MRARPVIAHRTGPRDHPAGGITRVAHHPEPGPNGLWRVLILDRHPADPKWILATVATPGDVRPARPDTTLDEVTAAWVASAAGLFRPALTPLPGALCWRVDEGGLTVRRRRHLRVIE
jgi:hypothetical protein